MPFVENARDKARATAGHEEQGVQNDADAFVGAAQKGHYVTGIEKR